MKHLMLVSLLLSVSAEHGIVKTIAIDGNIYPEYDLCFAAQWNLKHIEWGFTNKTSASGLGPIENVSSLDITCRFASVTPAALVAVARVGSDVVYKWTDYYQSHEGPVITVTHS